MDQMQAAAQSEDRLAAYKANPTVEGAELLSRKWAANGRPPDDRKHLKNILPEHRLAALIAGWEERREVFYRQATENDSWLLRDFGIDMRPRAWVAVAEADAALAALR